jgi:hypothetical protein
VNAQNEMGLAQGHSQLEHRYDCRANIRCAMFDAGCPMPDARWLISSSLLSFHIQSVTIE